MSRCILETERPVSNLQEVITGHRQRNLLNAMKSVRVRNTTTKSSSSDRKLYSGIRVYIESATRIAARTRLGKGAAGHVGW
jgi:hypothetical protein